MSNYKVTIVNGEAEVEERTVVQALTDSLQAVFDPKVASVGWVSSAAAIGSIYGAMVFTKYRHTGELSYNPF